jgi:hypothetical protein
MAAEATFTLRAVDATKQAFASVQNSLQKIQSTTKTIAKGLTGFLGFQAVVGAVSKLNSTLEDAEKNSVKLGLSSDEVDKLTITTDAADQAALAFQKTIAQTAIATVGMFTSQDIAARAAAIRLSKAAEQLKPLSEEAANLERQFDDLGKSESLMANEAMNRAKVMREEANAIEGGDPVAAARKRNEARKMELDATKSLIEIDKKYAAASEAFGVAQSKLYEGNVSASERLIGLRAREYELLKDTASLDKSVAANAMEKLVPIYEKINALQIEQNRLGNEAGQIIASGFEDAILAGEKLSDVLKQVARDLIRLVFQNVVTAPLAAGIGGAINAAFGGFRAMGGPVSGGTPYIVGERGPELFVPRASGSIVSNSNMNQGGGSAGPSINVNYNIAAGVTRSELAPILEQERRRLKAEIPDMVRRGGAYRSAFA